MAREAVFMVGLVALGALFALAVQIARLRTRVLGHERAGAELSRTVAAVQGWAAQELRALRSEFTVTRVDASAARVTEQRAQKRVATAETTPELEDSPEDPRDTVAMAAPETPTAPPDDEEATTVFDRDPPRYAARFRTLRSPAPREPLAHPDLIGCEDIADEANRLHLGPDETTPPRHGRAALLVPAFRGPEQGQTA
jgi:hypothetical protein